MLNVTLSHWVVFFGRFEIIHCLHLPKSRAGLTTILWHACQKSQEERFLGHAAFIAVQFFCFVLPYIYVYCEECVCVCVYICTTQCVQMHTIVLRIACL